MKLTTKEREAAEMYARGLTREQIAEQLGLTPTAVSVRMCRAARKRGIRDTQREGQILVARRVLGIA